MQTHDSTVKLARAVAPGDVLVAVGPDGEQLHVVREVAREAGRVVLVTDGQTVTLGHRDQVRVAHPDVAQLHREHDEADAQA